jgi:hypothetical protein
MGFIDFLAISWSNFAADVVFVVEKLTTLTEKSARKSRAALSVFLKDPEVRWVTVAITILGIVLNF